MFHLGDDQGCPGCRLLPFGCSANVRPTFLNTQTDRMKIILIRPGAQCTHYRISCQCCEFEDWFDFSPSKLASLWIDELTLSFNCFTAVKRETDKNFGLIKLISS